MKPVVIDLNDDPNDLLNVSHQGSLHSLPEHLSPHAASGSGSRAPSAHTQYGSSGSGSSRYSHMSPNGSGSSSQLGHSNSITSDGRRRQRREAGEPLLSSPGSSVYGRARLSAFGSGPRSALSSPQRSPPPDVTSFGSTGVTTTASMSDISGGSHTTRTTLVEPHTGVLAPHSVVHWPTNDQNLTM